MSIKDFTRTYYVIEKNGNQTLVYPYRRVSWDEKAGSPSLARPLDPSLPITIELWQVAEQSDIDEYPWAEGEPITTEELVDLLILESNTTPLLVDGTDEQDEEGMHYEGQDARYFGEGDPITPDDIRVSAYEEIDKDAPERCEDYILINKEDGTVDGMLLTAFAADLILWEDETLSSESMVRASITREVDLTPLRFAVLAKHRDILELVGAFATREKADLLATIHRDEGEEAIVKEIALG